MDSKLPPVLASINTYKRVLFLIAVKFSPRKAQLELSSAERRRVFLFASPSPRSTYCLRISLSILSNVFNRVILQVKCGLQVAVGFSVVAVSFSNLLLTLFL